MLDADALNALAAGAVPPGALPENTVLTPHPGEMARLTGLTVAQVQADRPGVAARYAARHRCVLVLKGSGTVIAAPDGRLLHNGTGNPGLARGGSGDILAGMIAALLARGLPPPTRPPAASGCTGPPPTAARPAKASLPCCPTTFLTTWGGWVAAAGRHGPVSQADPIQAKTPRRRAPLSAGGCAPARRLAVGCMPRLWRALPAQSIYLKLSLSLFCDRGIRNGSRQYWPARPCPCHTLRFLRKIPRVGSVISR